MRVFANAHFAFVEKRRGAYVVSGALLGLLLVTAIFFQVTRGSWLDYGVDFRGGTIVQVKVARATDVNEVRGVVNSVLAGSEVTRFGSEDEFLIRAPEFEEGSSGVADRITQAMNEHYGAGQITITRTEAVGPKVGAELQTSAILALLLSFAATLVYLAFRFEWRYGVAAIIATLHDIVITVGLISLLQLEVSLTTVAAILTIVGYSLNDTIIVFDRVRENVKASGRRDSFIALLNRSINETLPRTLLTAGTTVASLLALFVFGGEIIRDFALILILGIAIGTYSSILIASPALLEIETRWPRSGSGAAARKAESARAAV